MYKTYKGFILNGACMPATSHDEDRSDRTTFSASHASRASKKQSLLTKCLVTFDEMHLNKEFMSEFIQDESYVEIICRHHFKNNCNTIFDKIDEDVNIYRNAMSKSKPINIKKSRKHRFSYY